MIIRKMSLEDIPKVISIDEKSFNKVWNEGMFSDEIKKEYSDYFVAEEDRELLPTAEFGAYTKRQNLCVSQWNQHTEAKVLPKK